MSSAPQCSTRSPPWLLRFRSSQEVIVLTVCAATFTDGFVYAVWVPVLPVALRETFGIPAEHVQIWSSALLGIFGAIILLGSPILGRISDGEKSRKSTYIFGLTCLSGGVLALVVTKPWMLVVSRILQGFSVAVVYTVGLALVADTVDPKDIGYYMGFALSCMSCGVLIGPLIGSLVFNLGGYFAVVGIMGVMALLDIILRLFMIEKAVAATYEVTACPTERTSLLLPADSQELKPDIPRWKAFDLLSNPRVTTALYGVFVHVIIITAFDAILPVYLEKVFGWNSVNVALCYFAIAVPNTLLGPLVGLLSDKYGPMAPALWGCIFTGISMVLLQIIQHNTKEQVALLLVLLALAGTALPFIISPLAADLFYVVEILTKEGDAAAYAQSYGLFTCAMASGTLIGPILGGFLKETFSWTVMAWGLGLFVASGAIPIYIYTGRNPEAITTL